MISAWDLRFLELAKHVAQWSKDPSTKVGAVIADGKLVRSLGFNGFPPSCEDRPEWLNNREVKYKLVIHAESNALVHSGHSVVGCTVFTYPLAPCPECSKLLVASGIKRVVAGIDVSATSTGRYLDSTDTQFVFKCNGIEYEEYYYPSGGHTGTLSEQSQLLGREHQGLRREPSETSDQSHRPQESLWDYIENIKPRDKVY